MTKDKYNRIAKPYRESKRLLSMLKGSNIALTLVGFASFPVLLVFLWFYNCRLLPCYLLIPGLCFLLLTIARKKINAKRPYEILDIEPLIAKEKKGQSFPSRHVFSFCLIAGCWYSVCIPVGIVLSICALILAYIRVVGGIHFPKDVFAGTVIGYICSAVTIIVSAVLC